MRGSTLCLWLGALWSLGCTGGLLPAEQAPDAKEDCADGLDNDGNDLADCDDPACESVCAKPEDIKDPKSKKKQGKQKQGKRKDQRETGFAFEGWIGDGRPSLVATGTTKVPRYDTWRRGKKVGECSVKKGDKLKIKGSMVLTKKGTDVPIPNSGRVAGSVFGKVRLMTKKMYYDDRKEVSISLADVKSVVFLQPRAEGTCFFRVDGDVMETGCQAFAQTTVMPKMSWWVEVDCGGKGWVLVDDFKKKVKEERSF